MPLKKGFGIRCGKTKHFANGQVSLTLEHGKRERKKQWTCGQESYSLAEKDGTTTLTLASDVPPELEEYFKANYPKALGQIKVLAESKK